MVLKNWHKTISYKCLFTGVLPISYSTFLIHSFHMVQPTFKAKKKIILTLITTEGDVNYSLAYMHKMVTK